MFRPLVVLAFAFCRRTRPLPTLPLAPDVFAPLRCIGTPPSCDTGSTGWEQPTWSATIPYPIGSARHTFSNGPIAIYAKRDTNLQHQRCRGGGPRRAAEV